jgi:hypothetical protein
LERRQFLFPVELKRPLFNLFYVWCSRAVSAPSDLVSRRNGCPEVGPFVEQKAIQVFHTYSFSDYKSQKMHKFT